MSKKILLIESDTETTELAVTILENIGYEVKATGDSRVGLTWWRDEHPDLVLFNPQMQVGDAHSLHSVVSGDPLLRQAKLVYLVPHTEFARVKAELGLSTTQTLAMPFEFEDLMNRVQQLIGPAFDE